jgi:hypothetical protein
LQGSEWQNGQAVGYVYQIQALMMPFGRMFGSLAPDWVFRVLTYQTLITEGGFVIFMFAPFLQPSLRLVGLAMSIGLHLGIGLMMTQPLPDFSAVMFSSYLLFVEGDWYAILDDKLRAIRQPSIMRLPREGGNPGWLLLAVTSELEIAVDPVNPTHSQSETRNLLGHLPLSRFWGFLLRFASVQWAMQRVASLFTSRSPLPLPVEESEASVDEIDQAVPRRRVLMLAPIVSTIALGLIMGTVIWWNVDSVITADGTTPATMPGPLRDAVLYSGIWQSWNMFAPIPVQVDGWIVVPGKFEDGTSLDVRTQQPYTTDLPVATWGPTMRWQKYDENLNANRSSAMLGAMGRYYCNQYNNVENRPVGKRLATLEIHYLFTPSHAPDMPPNTQQDNVLWIHNCLG